MITSSSNVHGIVLDGNQIATATQFATNNKAKPVQSLGVERFQTLSQARNLQSTGSLTIWMGAYTGRSSQEDAVVNRAGFEVTHRCQVQSDGTLVRMD